MGHCVSGIVCRGEMNLEIYNAESRSEYNMYCDKHEK